jgi:hypothetical protein
MQARHFLHVHITAYLGSVAAHAAIVSTPSIQLIPTAQALGMGSFLCNLLVF